MTRYFKRYTRLLMETNKRIFKLWSDSELTTAFEFTCKALDGSDYDRGALETAQAEATNVKEAFGRLLQLMHNAGILKSQEVVQIIGHGSFMS